MEILLKYQRIWPGSKNNNISDDITELKHLNLQRRLKQSWLESHTVKFASKSRWDVSKRTMIDERRMGWEQEGYFFFQIKPRLCQLMKLSREYMISECYTIGSFSLKKKATPNTHAPQICLFH